MDFLYNSIETCEKNVIYEITVFFNLITKLYIIMNEQMLQLIDININAHEFYI